MYEAQPHRPRQTLPRQPPAAGRPKICTLCGSRRNIDVDHIGGDESDDSPENKMWTCRPCNTLKGIVQARNRIGIRTRQFNPAAVPTFAQFKHHAAVLTGAIQGDAARATSAIRSTPPASRARYARQLAAANPFKSEAQRRKFFAMAERGEISQATLSRWVRGNPTAASPSYQQYAFGVSIHQRGAHDEGGRIIHATPPALRRKYAAQIAETKRGRRREEVPF